ncbi:MULTISPECIES: SGNH/GDSL hydrolase family protein [Anaeromyxobacter]|uniref:SGNH/GDSL hydrolase family protein n=1 Tax=Anaeromyxobacter TaxID=161492 RepID=UPI001F5A76D1|nr:MULTISPECIES: SGNH/GDSL hydrolase family protein [unclassified Anaeromyxobacter]
MSGARTIAGRWARGVTAAAALLAACMAGHAAPPRDAAVPDAPQVIFFGSSTTAGTGASRPERRWTTLLARHAGWSEVNEGLPGSTLTDVTGRPAPSGELRWRALAGSGLRPGVVVVMYGANDAIAGVPLGEADAPGTFRHAAASVLRGLRAAFPRAVLVVCTPQPGRRLDRARRAPYDAALADEARAVGAVVVRGDEAFAPEALPRFAADTIHLNDAGHAALAAYVERALLDARVISRPHVAKGAGFGVDGAMMP